MISAWDVYWVMQLDDIRSLFWVLTFLTFVSTLVPLIWNIFSIIDTHDSPHSCDPELRRKLQGFRWKLCAAGVAACAFFQVTDAFIPSTRTAAAIILLPVITSDESIEIIKPEARELYELAKDAIRGLAKDKGQSVEKESK